MNDSATSLAKGLWQARCEGTTIPRADIESEDQAYIIQSGLNDAASANVIGYKIGATLAPALDMLQLSEPFFGPLFDTHCRANGGEIPLSAAHKNMLETEFVVGISADLPPREAVYERDDITSIVGWVSGGFEIVGTRFDMEFKGAGRHFIADSGANVDFLMGTKFTDWQSLDLANHAATLHLNGEEMASGHSGMSLWEHPFGPVAWLANHRVMAERGLKAGDIITTGSCTGMTPVVAGDVATANFGVLGEVSVNFVAL